MRAAGLALLAALVAPPSPAAVTVAVRDQNGPAAGVVVALEPLDAPAPAATGMRASIDQVHKEFVPHLSVVQVGTAVDFPNSDDIRHEVYSFSPAKFFTLKLYAKRPAAPVIFDRPGLVVLGCNIHDQMSALVVVLATPYFGRTGPDGTVALAPPPGRYRLRVWDPALDRPVPLEPLAVRAEPQTSSVTISRTGEAGAVAAWAD